MLVVNALKNYLESAMYLAFGLSLRSFKIIRR